VSKRKRTKLIHAGRYVAEVDVELIEDETGWSPYLTPEDAFKLDDVRDALLRGDLQSASRLARVFELRPVASSWRRTTRSNATLRLISCAPNMQNGVLTAYLIDVETYESLQHRMGLLEEIARAENAIDEGRTSGLSPP